MASVPAIELRKISMQFGSRSLLKNVQLQINEGESFVLLGPSGQGKSVLMKIMAGLIEPTEGEVLVRGKNLLMIRGKEFQELSRTIGMLFQKNALFDSISVGENVAFPMREITHSEEQEIEKTVRFFLGAVDILHAKDLFPDEISGGMQKRLGIARALALRPKIVFYDDPTAGLDPITSRKIVQLILALKKESGATVVSITNDMSRAYQLADRIGMVVDGELLITGNPQETKAHKDPRVHQFIRGALEGPLTVRS